METDSQLQPTTPLDTLDTFDDMASSQSHFNFLRLEDLHSTPPSQPSYHLGDSQETPPPVIVQSKPAKKRKSWGQQLPEPTTALPPRKRAKTDDEKEQRRIERIKRNRAAAHNSRERKRAETEVLAIALAKANARLDAYHRLHGPLPSSVVLPEVTLSTEGADTPAPSLVESRGSVDASDSPASPEDSLFDYPVTIKEEPNEYTFQAIPPAYESKQQTLSHPDPTQHSAAMLCDLPCRSGVASSTNSKDITTATTSSASFWWTTLFIYLMHLQLQTFYKASLLAIWTHSPSRLARLMQASTLRLTSPSTTSSMTPRLSRSALAQHNAATSLMTLRQGAQALQRQSLIEDSRLRNRTAAEQHHNNTSSNTMAFEEQKGEMDPGNGEIQGGIRR